MTISRHSRPALWLTLGFAILAGCREQPRPASARFQDALPFLPLPPQPEFVSRNGSPDALQVVLTTPLSVDSTILYYREALKHAAWIVTGDQPAAGGGRTLLATKGKQPLWLMIGPDPAGHGTRVSINGAVVSKQPEGSGRLPPGGVPPDSSKRTGPAPAVTKPNR